MASGGLILAVEEDELWQRLAAYDFDRADSELPFSARLARENHWTRDHARAVLEEYRRFVYLAQRAGHPVTPSDAVDQAWHLHLLYSEEYWRRFCPEILGRDLHHYPTAGGPAERAKFRAWYEDTLASYRRLFGVEPPAEIWPDTDTRFSMAAGPRRAASRSWSDRLDEWLDTLITAVWAVSTGWIGYMGVTSEVPWDIRWISIFLLVVAFLAALVALFGHRLRRGKRRRAAKWRSSGGGDDGQAGDGGHPGGDASGCGSGCGGGCGG